MKKKLWILGGVAAVTVALLAAVERPTPGAKVCEDLKAEIRAKIEKRGVKKFSLEIVDNADVGERQVVGSCNGGKNKIVYARE